MKRKTKIEASNGTMTKKLPLSIKGKAKLR